MKNEKQVIEKKLSLSTKEIRNLLDLDEFKVTRRTAYVYGEDKRNVKSIMSMTKTFIVMFNCLMRQNELLITEKCFVSNVMAEFYKNAKKKNIAINDKMKEYLLLRTEGAYRGFIAEIYAITLLVESVPNILVVRNEALDLDSGVDFGVIWLDTNYIQSTHVTSIGGLDYIGDKEKKNDRQSFLEHLLLTYNYSHDDNHSFLRNGFPFFYKSYLLDTFEKSKNTERKGLNVYSDEFDNAFVNIHGEWEFIRSNKVDLFYEEKIQDIKRRFVKYD